MKTPYVLGAIFARGGSKGVPRKNIRLLAGKPLLAYAIEAGRGVAALDRLIVSTDDAEIAAVACEYGAEIPFLRPPELATDTAAELQAWKHVLASMEGNLGHPIDVLVSIPPTSPLRKSDDVARCLDLLLASDADIVVAVTPALRSPFFNMVTVDAEANARLVIPPEDRAIVRRQDAPECFDITTVAYAARSEYVQRTESVLAGKVKAVVVPRARALDIDTLEDFAIAECLLHSGSPV